jgi:UTP-glucose-1-phosphate uridylyltransferase
MSPTQPPALVVLAAGMGSRYGGLKQMDSIGPSGETILDYSVYDALLAGFARVVFVLRKEIEQGFREAVSVRFEDRAPIEYVLQELDRIPAGFRPPAGRTKPWGGTHAVLMAAGCIHEPFAVINADDFYGAEGFRLLAADLQSGAEDYAMVGFVLSNTLSEFGAVSRAICRVNQSGYLTSVVEMTGIARDHGQVKDTDAGGCATWLSGDELVSMNMWGFTPRVFDQLRQRFEAFLEQYGSDLKRECYLPTSINELIREGEARVKVLRTPEQWFGVTYREDHPHVAENIRRLIDEGRYPESLWS